MFSNGGVTSVAGEILQQTRRIQAVFRRRQMPGPLRSQAKISKPQVHQGVEGGVHGAGLNFHGRSHWKIRKYFGHNFVAYFGIICLLMITSCLPVCMFVEPEGGLHVDLKTLEKSVLPLPLNQPCSF